MKLDSIAIESPEKIVFHYSIAKTGVRIAAYIVDVIVQFMVIAVLIIFFMLFGFIDAGAATRTFDQGFVYLAIAFFYLLYFFFQWGYFVFFEMFKQGQSPGKRTMKIRVIKSNGEPLDFSTIVLRNLIRSVDNFPVFHFMGGLISILDKKSRRLGDLVAGTLVVREITFDLSEPSYETRFTTPRRQDSSLRFSNRLNEQELFIIRKFLKERDNLTEDKQVELAEKLAARVRERAGVAETIHDPIEFLEEIYRSHSDED